MIRPRLQMRLILTFVGLSALSLLLQYILFMSTLGKTAQRILGSAAGFDLAIHIGAVHDDDLIGRAALPPPGGAGR